MSRALRPAGWTCLLVAPLLSAAPASAQEGAVRYDFLVGQWEGVLEYTDYSDDSTRVTLTARMRAIPDSDGERLRLTFDYVEPDGRTFTSEETLFETPSGLVMGGLWQVADSEYEPAGERYLLDLRQSGQDNNRSASIRNTVLRNSNELTITKWVRYEGSDRELQRHQFRFDRVDGGETLHDRIEPLPPAERRPPGGRADVVRAGWRPAPTGRDRR